MLHKVIVSLVIVPAPPERSLEEYPITWRSREPAGSIAAFVGVRI
jgi:hypothetical protein